MSAIKPVWPPVENQRVSLRITPELAEELAVMAQAYPSLTEALRAAVALHAFALSIAWESVDEDGYGYPAGTRPPWYNITVPPYAAE